MEGTSYGQRDISPNYGNSTFFFLSNACHIVYRLRHNQARERVSGFSFSLFCWKLSSRSPRWLSRGRQVTLGGEPGLMENDTSLLLKAYNI